MHLTPMRDKYHSERTTLTKQPYPPETKTQHAVPQML